MNDIRKSYGKAIQKALAVVCLFCMLLSVGVVAAGAQGDTKIIVSSSTVERGGSASVAFNIEGNPGIWALKLRINYDQTALALDSVTVGSVFEANEFVMSENLDTDPYVVTASGNALADKTTNGAIVTLNFTVKDNAAFESYPVTAEVSQVINVNGDKIIIGTTNGSVSVVDCVHTNKEWVVTKEAGCEEDGVETLTCKKCNQTFETRPINATGHLNTEIRGYVAPTKTTTGYTGDTYCTVCGELISLGETISKLTDDAPQITSGTKSTFNKNSEDPLVFVSNAAFSDFVRVEIDGTVLDENNYTAASGSTIITIKADFLKTLDAGEHTVSVVSTTGTANAQFTVQNNSGDPSGEGSVDTSDKPFDALIFIGVAVALLVGVVVALFIIRRRRFQ